MQASGGQSVGVVTIVGEFSAQREFHNRAGMRILQIIVRKMDIVFLQTDRLNA